MLRLGKEMVVIALMVIAGIYLINPTLGVFELLPDNLPVVGNIDEGLATVILLSALRHYGIDPTRMLGERGSRGPIQGRVRRETRPPAS